MSNDTDVLDVLQRWSAAELTGNTDAYADLLAPDFVGVGPAGFVLTRDQWVQRHAEGLVNHEFSVTDPSVRSYADTAIVSAVQHQRTVARGHEVTGAFRLVAVMVRAEAGWSIAHLQLSGPLIAPGQTPSFVR